MPLVRAGQVVPFVRAAERLGVRVEHHLEAVSLPASALEEPDRMIARAHLWRFTERIARNEGISDFGLEAAMAGTPVALGALGRKLLGAPTLAAALRGFADELRLHSTHACFRLRETPAGLFVARHDAGYQRAANDAVEQYSLMLVADLVLYAAPGWRPRRLWLRSHEPRWAERSDFFADAEPNDGGQLTALEIPRELLALPMPGPPSNAVDLHGDPAIAHSFSGSLTVALRSLVGHASLQLAAELAGISERTVRLRLHEEGTSWRRILDGVRFEHAAARLRNPDVAIGDIAAELGYSDAAHFGRAFRRWACVTPTEFRCAARASTGTQS